MGELEPTFFWSGDSVKLAVESPVQAAGVPRAGAESLRRMVRRAPQAHEYRSWSFRDKETCYHLQLLLPLPPHWGNYRQTNRMGLTLHLHSHCSLWQLHVNPSCCWHPSSMKTTISLLMKLRWWGADFFLKFVGEGFGHKEKAPSYGTYILWVWWTRWGSGYVS